MNARTSPSGDPADAPQERFVRATRSGTSIATSSATSVYVRDVDLSVDLMGKLDFTSMMIFQMTGRVPDVGERNVVDAVLVALMEHGLTPSSISARLIYASSPDAMQSAVAAGLLGAGGVFLGAMEELAELLQEGVEAERAGIESGEDFARRIVAQRFSEGLLMPGFGHHIHRPDDPRTSRLLDIAADNGVSGAHTKLLETLGDVVDEVKGRHITINVTGAVAAVLSDLGYPWRILRGFSLVARSAGLVGHILEEQERPLGRELWDLVERAVPYEGSVQTTNLP